MEQLRAAKVAENPYPLVMIDAAMPAANGFALARRITDESLTTGPLVLMLTSGGNRNELNRIKGLDHAIHLLKPILEADLREVSRPPSVTGMCRTRMEKPMKTRAGRRSGDCRRRRHALLVDDNVFNQKVGLQKLAKMGHEVTVVGAAPKALAAMDDNRSISSSWTFT